jgi:hypothetical protein
MDGLEPLVSSHQGHELTPGTWSRESSLHAWLRHCPRALPRSRPCTTMLYQRPKLASTITVQPIAFIGGEGGIRTPGTFRTNGFQVLCALCHPFRLVPRSPIIQPLTDSRRPSCPSDTVLCPRVCGQFGGQILTTIIRTMSPDLAEAIRHEHNATVEAVQRAQARALHLSALPWKMVLSLVGT